MTTIARRDPLHLDMPEWMSRWLDDRGFDRLFTGTGGAGIRVEELSEEGTHVVRAELPGVDPDEDVDITVHDGMLHIRAERTEKQEHAENSSFRSEFHYGRFERALPLPPGATAKDVSATYKDGVLEVRLPVEPAARESAEVPISRAD